MRLCLLPLIALVACAHAPKSGGLETLKPAVETFHQRIRWRDYRGAAELLLPERREAFLKARAEQQDDKDLTITDYQLEDARLLGEGDRALVVARLSWMRLPSISEHSDLVTTELVFRDAAWWVARQDKGPFAPELDVPYQPPDAGR